MILTVQKRKFCLQKQIVSRNESARDQLLHGASDCRFVVVFSLIGRINPPKTLLQSEFDQTLRLCLFPRRSIQD